MLAVGRVVMIAQRSPGALNFTVVLENVLERVVDVGSEKWTGVVLVRKDDVGNRELSIFVIRGV